MLVFAKCWFSQNASCHLFMQHFLNFFPEPHVHGSFGLLFFLPTFGLIQP